MSYIIPKVIHIYIYILFIIDKKKLCEDLVSSQFILFYFLKKISNYHNKELDNTAPNQFELITV